jgi:hypothetical protein
VSTVEDPVGFIYHYYSLLPQDTDAALKLLSPSAVVESEVSGPTATTTQVSPPYPCPMYSRVGHRR